ncbi:AraC family transcriptional regulator [Flavobacterium reichenbachii]|uniref:HTH araC/xylS-type domain-containing protein n=1 Tax=Flavobacterium reichenbachii TaxID=362418 RepID=A0A085ZET2_9FLAO|nr:AraC family transcriptional regulator [Flavobacterium reichenbachii]KFF02946.1 hypothetical protein IW19_22635 [Flavobacterium reichenbachii]OXB16936.1 AraC family transcriptional regulator [Flavobacterium reichenbachii]
MDISIPIFNNIKDACEWAGIPISETLCEDFIIQEAQQWNQNKALKVPEIYKANYFTIFLVSEGSAVHRYNKEALILESSSIFITAPGHYRNYSLDNISKAYFISFTETFLNNYFFSEIYAEFPFLLSEAFIYTKVNPEDYREIESITTEIKREMELNTKEKALIIGNMLEFMLLKIKEVFKQQFNPVNDGSKISLVVNTFYKDLDSYFKQILEGQQPKQLKAKDFSDLQYLNENYFSRLIKMKTGKTPSAWINNRLLNEAKTLLSETSLPISEIASLFHFASSRYFNFYFKKQTAMTPSKYRKSMQ